MTEEDLGRKLSRREQYRIASERDKRWIRNLNVHTMNNILWPLFVAFICLNFLDIYTTSIALSNPSVFWERNILAAKLFTSYFHGFLFAVVIKFAPALPLSYAVFVGDSERYHYHVRIVKASALAALTVGVAFYTLVVIFNNIPVLLSGTFSQ